MLVLGIALVFKLWMLLDASRRRVSSLWYLALIAPFGDVVYFFTVKLRAFDPIATIGEPLPTSPTLPELEREAEQSPSFHNRVRLAWALLDQGEHARASAYFEQALATHASDKEALFGLGLARLEQDDAAAAITALRPLVERSLAYRGYEAALALAEAYFRSGDDALAFELLDSVIADGRRLEHRVLFARYQLRAHDRIRALATLEEALRTFEQQPEPERRRDGAVATEARRLLRTLEQPS